MPELAAPTRAIDCNDMPGVNGDPGFLAGFDWTGEKHQYGEPVTLYVCVSSQGGGSVMVTPVPSGVTVTPDGTGVTITDPPPWELTHT